jgi:hypothetical protein
VRIYEHSIKKFHKPTQKYRYYIEPSPASIGEPCPVSEIWYELGEIGTDEAKNMQRTFSRSVKFISNILVVNDPANPENNGKVFYWKYGVKLFEKFQAALEPSESQLKIGKKPIQLFDPMEGANIVLDAKEVAGFINYDDTSIEPPSQAFETEEEADRVVMEDCIDLTEFISEDYYKPYAELKRNLAWVLDGSPEEAYLVAHGSKVISMPYKDLKKQQSEQKDTESVAPKTSMEDYRYEPKTKKEAPKTEQKAPEPEAPVEKPSEPKQTKKNDAPFDVDEGFDDDELESILSEIV